MSRLAILTIAAVFTMYATPGLSRLAMDRRRRLSPEA